MPVAVGYTPQRAARIDRDSILLGPVNAGRSSSGNLEDASTRTGAARLLEGRLNPFDSWKVVAVGGQSSSSGGYVIQIAHAPQDGALSTASAWGTLGAIAFSGTAEIPLGFTGDQTEAVVRAAAAAAGAAITGKVRVTALRLRPRHRQPLHQQHRVDHQRGDDHVVCRSHHAPRRGCDGYLLQCAAEWRLRHQGGWLYHVHL